MNQNEILPAQLLSGLNERDEKIFDYYYHMMKGVFWNYANNLVKDIKDAEDIVHDSFMEFLTRPNEFESLEKLQGYLFKTIKNKCIDLYRSKKRHYENHEQILYLKKDDTEDLFKDILRAEFREIVAQIIDTFPPKRKEICILLFIEELPTSEVASRLNISQSTVRKVKKVGRKKILEALKRKFPH